MADGAASSLGGVWMVTDETLAVYEERTGPDGEAASSSAATPGTSGACPSQPCPYCILGFDHTITTEDAKFRYVQMQGEMAQKSMELAASWARNSTAMTQIMVLRNDTTGLPACAPMPPPTLTPPGPRARPTGADGRGVVHTEAPAAGTADEPMETAGQTFKGHPSYYHFISRRGYVWMVKIGKGKNTKWSEWEDDWQSWLEDKYQSDRHDMRGVEYGDQKYSINLGEMWQENDETGKRRPLKRMERDEYLRERGAQ